MYNNTTKSYTLEDNSSMPYDWITRDADRDFSQGMTDVEIYAWVDRLIEEAQEGDLGELEEDAENTTYPVMGYSTTQIFEDADEYITFKTEEINEDYAVEREHVFNLIKTWINDPLDQVMTTVEVAKEFGVADATVRQAIGHGFIEARQSGATWLVRRADAKKRWKK